MMAMPDQNPTLEYGRKPPKLRRWRQWIVFDMVKGLLFAYVVALAVLGFLWAIGALVTIRSH
jgi:hypothetical protein